MSIAYNSRCAPRLFASCQWCMAALTSVLCFSLVPSLADANYHTTGHWTNRFPLYAPHDTSGGCSDTLRLGWYSDTPLHAAMLYEDGQKARITYFGASYSARYWVYDPLLAVSANSEVSISPTTVGIANYYVGDAQHDDIFCSGHSVLPNGKLMTFGGKSTEGGDIGCSGARHAVSGFMAGYSVGTKHSYLYDPLNAGSRNGWYRKADMSEGRWYPSATPLADGTVLVTSGDRGNSWISFGGATNTASPPATNGTATAIRAYEPNVSGYRSTDVPALEDASAPSARAFATAVYDSRSGHDLFRRRRMLMFGGQSSADSLLNDIWMLHRDDGNSDQSLGDKWGWVQLTPDAGSATVAGRSGHTACYEPTRVTSGTIPNLTLDNQGSMVVFGGRTRSGGTTTATNELLRFSIDPRWPNGIPFPTSGKWESVTLTPAVNGGPVPAGRYFHSAAIIPGLSANSAPNNDEASGANAGFMVLFGGVDTSGQLIQDLWKNVGGDTLGTTVWVLDLGTYQWSQKYVKCDSSLFSLASTNPYRHSPPIPVPRMGAVTVYDPVSTNSKDTRDCIVLFGGQAGTHIYNDTWRLNFRKNNTGAELLAGTTSEPWEWRLLSATSDLGATTSTVSPAPPARAFATLGYDPVQIASFHLFGGLGPGNTTASSGNPNEFTISTATPLSDSWILPGTYFWMSSTEKWTAMPLSPSPTAVYGHACVLDPTDVSSRLVERYNPFSDSWASLTWKQYLPGYPSIFTLPNGRLLFSGPTVSTQTLNLSSGWSTTTPSSPGLLSRGAGAAAVQYRPGEVMKVGSWTGDQLTDAISFNAHPDSASWAGTGDLPSGQGRYHHNLTILPNGNVFMSGGTDGTAGMLKGGDNFDHSRRQPYLWIPAVDTAGRGHWDTTNLPETLLTARTYHSNALLLPDGRVLSMGGSNVTDPVDPYVWTGEIYTPGYLFKTGGTMYSNSERPQVSAAPARLHYGSPGFSITLGDTAGIKNVCLIRPASVTHSVNFDQTYVPLKFTQSGTHLSVQMITRTVPNQFWVTSNIAPPGWYMLFVTDQNDVPSIAKWVHIWPLNPVSVSTSAHCTSVDLLWTSPNDCSDGVAVDHYRVFGRPTSKPDTTAIKNSPSSGCTGTCFELTPGAPGSPGSTETLNYASTSYGTQFKFSIVGCDADGNFVTPFASASWTVPSQWCMDELGIQLQPERLSLGRPSPTPTRNGFTLRFGIPQQLGGAPVNLCVFDAAGRKVMDLWSGQATAGYQERSWDVVDGDGRALANGVYFLRLQVGGQSLKTKLVIAR